MSDAVWTSRCVERLVELDPALQPVLAEELAADLCTRTRWRSMAPDAAAQVLFDFNAKK